MPPLSPPPSPSYTWIRVWIAIGVFAMIATLAFPVMVVYKIIAEAKRLEACRNGQRIDCESSPLWEEWLKGTSSTRP